MRPAIEVGLLEARTENESSHSGSNRKGGT
jgi:hypothetical protein